MYEECPKSTRRIVNWYIELLSIAMENTDSEYVIPDQSKAIDKNYMLLQMIHLFL